MGFFFLMTDSTNITTKDKAAADDKCQENAICDFIENLTGVKLAKSIVSGKKLEDKGVLPGLKISDEKASNAKGSDAPSNASVNGADGEVPGSPRATAGDMANQFSTRAESELRKRHSGEHNTISGKATLREIKYSNQHEIKFPQTPDLVAILQLGPDVTQQQRELYTKVVAALNKDKLVDNGSGQMIFKEGTKIQLPGQTRDGGVTYVAGQENVTLWNDKSMLRKHMVDGSGYASYKQDGNDVSVSWSRNKIEGNKWNTEILAITPDEKKGYMEKSETGFDSKGRVVVKVKGSDEKTVETVRVTENASSVYELKRSRDGEFHGKQRIDGKEVAGDFGMTKDGRIYKQTVNADGTVDKSYLDEKKTDTFSKGKLVQSVETDVEKKSTTTKRYANGEVVSMTVTDKDKNVSQLKRNQDGDLVGEKRDRDGNVIDRVGINNIGWYTRKDTALGEELSYENGRTTTYDKSGAVLETRQKDAKGRLIVESFTSSPNTATVYENGGTFLALTMGSDGAYHGERRDAAGTIIDTNVGMTTDRKLFTEKNESGIATVKFEDGRSVSRDGDGKLVGEGGKDAAGRQFERFYRPGEAVPYKIEMPLNGNGKVTEFNRAADGRYIHEEKSTTGETIRTIEVDPREATLTYKSAGTRLSLYKDGSSESEIDLGSGHIRRTRMKSTDLITTEIQKDAKGAERITKITSVDQKNGVVFENIYHNGVNDQLIIRKDGGTVDLKLKDGQWAGTNTKWFGVKEEVIMYPNSSIMYKNPLTGEVREEKISKDDHRLINDLKEVEFDANTGRFVRDGAGSLEVQTSRAPGRVDSVAGDGSRFGVTLTGELSYQTSDGSSGVIKPDNEGAQLAADGTIEMWSNGAKVIDQLTPGEEAYLKSHPDVDRRNVLEIHRRFANDKKRIDEFYEQLQRADSAKDLSQSERKALVDSLMHHVAHPSEIYQGAAPTCGIANVERDMAMTQPDKYASFVMDALVDGTFQTSDGTWVGFDTDNLKAKDFSGRDIASRAFQTAALNVLRYPHYAFENALSGGGEFHKTFHGVDMLRTGEKDQLGGLYLEELARMRNQLTGESKAVVHVDSADTLAKVFRKNNGKPMVIWVDSKTYPFGGGPLDNGVGGHFTMVTGVEDGPPTKFYVQNQWGLESDHSTRTTAIEGEDLFNNMTRSNGKLGYVLVDAPNSAKRYDAQVSEDGEVSYKEKGTANFDKNGKYIP